GEYVAAKVFDIDLNASASHRAIDGHFRSGPLAGRSANIKYGSRRDGTLDLVASLDLANHPNYYLVLTGPSGAAISSKGFSAPWVIQQVFLFEAAGLLGNFAVKGTKPGVASSVRSALWAEAMIYPQAVNPGLVINDEQREALQRFRDID
ncbi:MAG: hypothetical protein ACR2GI_03730, partial [Thermomicrobiales bacterium]